MKPIDQIILENQNLIYSITNYFSNYKNKEDLFQVGVIGIMKAYHNYDENFNIKFTTYAYTYILGEMKKYIREDKSIKVSRNISSLNAKIEQASNMLSQKLYRNPTPVELSNFLGIPEILVTEALNSKREVKSIDEPIASDSKEVTLHETIPDRVLDINTLIALKQELTKLDSAELELLKNRYFDDKTQMETANSLGMTQVQVSRKEQKVLTKLRNNLS
jgi:RNA polymerase sporulation-specific sigma factor